ncbi:MAG: ABC transporter permease subunit [Luteolibacter sp.]
MKKLGSFLTASFGFISATIILVAVTAIAGVIILRGHGAISIPFLTTETTEAGASGGILWQITGTLILILTAAIIAIPIATALALLNSFILKPNSLAQRLLGFTLQVFNAIPSIIFGIIGLMIFVRHLEWGKSWLAGGIVLGIMIAPTIAIMLAHRIYAIPSETIEAARGLGLRKGQVMRSVILPQSASALASGTLLGLARAAGETAPILFIATIFSGATLPTGITEQPVLSLSYHIFILSQDSFQESAKTNLWGAALVLVSIVTFFGLLSIPLRNRLHNAADHA